MLSKPGRRLMGSISPSHLMQLFPSLLSPVTTLRPLMFIGNTLLVMTCNVVATKARGPSVLYRGPMVPASSIGLHEIACASTHAIGTAPRLRRYRGRTHHHPSSQAGGAIG